jgi:hypothetical protein
VVAAVLEGLLVVELVESLAGLHEGKLATKADLLLAAAAAPIQRPRTSVKKKMIDYR